MVRRVTRVAQSVETDGPPIPAGPLFVTETSVDPVLNEPYVDADRPGTATDPATGVTVDYRYIHGGFTGTNARFSFYFPAAEAYRGRFFQATYPLVTNEDEGNSDAGGLDSHLRTLAFAISNGAYAVATNNGGDIRDASGLGGYRVNAAAAKYSRIVAADVYGTTSRPRGYLYGGSGGAYQTLGAMENTQGVWDGAVPFVPGVPDATPSFGSVQALALRLLRHKLPQIAEAMEVGGSGDPFAGLTPEEHAALLEVTRLGFPLRGWWQHEVVDAVVLPAVQGGVRVADPDYVEDFWTKPGYEGAEPALRAARVRLDTTVEAVDGGGLRLADAVDGDVWAADLIINSGPGAGQSVLVGEADGPRLTFHMFADPTVKSLIQPGTSVTIDNSWIVALHYIHRHQAVPRHLYAWDQYRDSDGNGLYPQREVRIGAQMGAASGGAVATGRFHGKMIMVAGALDVHAYPWSADWYRRQASTEFGDGLDERFRLWFVDNANHGPLGPGHWEPGAGNALAVMGPAIVARAADYLVPYLGVLHQALLDLDDWVADAVSPPATSGYVIDENTQVQLAETADELHGVQPAVNLTAAADPEAVPASRVEALVGTPVTLAMVAEVPPGAGEIHTVEWDLEGTGTFSVSSQVDGGPIVKATETHTFTTPGTYLPTARVTSHRTGDPAVAYGHVSNVARVRVVVHADAR
jgi:hypothetical protein